MAGPACLTGSRIRCPWFITAAYSTVGKTHALIGMILNYLSMITGQ